jgi:FtsP/CotA-like multicopper oxidase with cupredoxin domain
LIPPLNPPQIVEPGIETAKIIVLQDNEQRLSFNLMDFIQTTSEKVLFFVCLRFDSKPVIKVRLGETEIWEFVNPTPDSHPIHVHLVVIQVWSRQNFDSTAYSTAFAAVNGVSLRSTPPVTVPVEPFLHGTPGPPLDVEVRFYITLLNNTFSQKISNNNNRMDMLTRLLRCPVK